MTLLDHSSQDSGSITLAMSSDLKETRDIYTCFIGDCSTRFSRSVIDEVAEANKKATLSYLTLQNLLYLIQQNYVGREPID